MLAEHHAKTLVFEEVVPALREMGVMDDGVFDTIFVENPRRSLVGSEAPPAPGDRGDSRRARKPPIRGA